MVLSFGSSVWKTVCPDFTKKPKIVALTTLPVPLPFNEGPGYFAGEWVTYKAERIDEYETKVTWNLYGCHTGGLHGKNPPHTLCLCSSPGKPIEQPREVGWTLYRLLGVPTGNTEARPDASGTNGKNQGSQFGSVYGDGLGKADQFGQSTDRGRGIWWLGIAEGPVRSSGRSMGPGVEGLVE